MTFLCVFVMAVIFFAYQMFYIKQLQTEIEHKPHVVPAQSGLQSTTQKETKRILRYILQFFLFAKGWNIFQKNIDDIAFQRDTFIRL